MKFKTKYLSVLMFSLLCTTAQSEEIIQKQDNIEPICKHTAMHYATSVEKFNYVKALLNRNEFTLFELNYQCETPVHIAAELGNIPILNLFYSYLGNFEIFNDDEQTPIMTAIENNQHQAILFMVEKGVNLETKDGKGKTVREYFLENGDYLTQKILKNEENKRTLDNFSIGQHNKDNELDGLKNLITEKENHILQLQKEGANPEDIKELSIEIDFLKKKISNLETIIKAQEIELAELRTLRELYDNNLKENVNNSPKKNKDNLNTHIPEDKYKDLLNKFTKSDETDLNQMSDELMLMELLSKPMYKIEKKNN
jgi:hypothetical protein